MRRPYIYPTALHRFPVLCLFDLRKYAEKKNGVFQTKGGEDEVWGWQAEQEMKGRERGGVSCGTDGANEEMRGRAEV